MHESYDYRLVVLSVVIAICVAYAALDLAGLTTAAEGKVRLTWLAGGAFPRTIPYLQLLIFR